MVQGTDNEVIEFVNNAINSGNKDLMSGIAESVTDLTDEQILKLLSSGSKYTVLKMIKNLNENNVSLFAKIDKKLISKEQAAIGVRIDKIDGKFYLVKPLCEDEQKIEIKDDDLYSKDVLLKNIQELNIDGIESFETVIHEMELVLLSNRNCSTEVVTSYLNSEFNDLKAKAFVHRNTDNQAIVDQMTADDAAGVDDDGFKLAMIADLNTNEMIQDNAIIVKYLLGANQNAPVRYAMFKNYVTVLMNGGQTIDGIDIDALVAEFVK